MKQAAEEEESVLDMILGYLGWKLNDAKGRYHVLRFLRTCRGEPVPTFDDFKAGAVRTKAA